MSDNTNTCAKAYTVLFTILQMVDFVVKIVRSFDVALDKTRVAAVGFGNRARIYFPLDFFETKDDFLENATDMLIYWVRAQQYMY